jgi:hypothetical protein
VANYFASLPAYRDPGGLDFSPLNSAVQNFGETNRQNVMAEYQAGQNRKAEGRANAAAGRAQATFDEARGKEALNQLAGIYQTIEEAPETERAGLYERLKPLYGSLAQKIPDFSTDLQQMGVDPNDHIAVGKLVVGRARGYQSEGVNSFGKTGSVFQDKDGNFYTAQFAANGERRIRPLDGMAPARGTTLVGDTLVNNATGGEVRNVGDALSRGEEAKGEGKARVEVRSALPKLEMGYQTFVQKSDRLTNVIDRAISRVGANTTGWGALLANIPESEALALRTDLDTIRANVGFDELQAMRDASPTGGALGQVSEQENRLLQSIRGSVDQFNSGQNVKENLGIIRESVTQLKALKAQQLAADRARVSSGGWRPDAAPAAPQPAPSAGALPPGEYVFDPSTGQLRKK